MLLKAADLRSGMLWLAIVLVLVVVAVLIFGRKKQEEVVIIRQISLKDLSAVWEKKGARTIHISKLSPLWRDEKILAREDEYPELQNLRAAAFMEKIRQWSWFNKFPQQKVICGQILKLLDQEGHCPSVVDIQGDVEGSWDENTYQLLAGTTLLDHSLNVAEQVVQLLSDDKACHVIPDTMIAALAHDLGKLESMRGYLYSLGEHPLAAGRPLAGIPGFKELRRKDEILQAIKLHHKRPQGLLGKTLKKADQKARQMELEDAALKIDTSEANPVEDIKPVPGKEKQGTKSTAAWKAQEDIYNETGGEGRKKSQMEKPQLMDISGWFDAEKFLDELKPYINKMFGRRFMAFSMSDGHVYFQAKVLEEVARKQAEQAGNMEIATMGQRDESMRSVLLSIVNHLRADHEVIARGLIKDNFFGGYFNVTRKIGKPIKGYYTPFHAEAFGSIAEMEQNKPKMLRDIVKVSPYLDNNADT
ncbi:MAG: HD domain-containing protein [Thermodesulfobacteriota bacterium]|nr:HD domain-containing protein [Thermodesulfobacteriota bacterium]